MTESGSPTSHTARSSTVNLALHSSSAREKLLVSDSIVGAFPEYDESEDGDDDAGFGDDFDDFEEGGEDAEFGDFDQGFQDTKAVPAASLQSLPTIMPSFVSRLAIHTSNHADVIIFSTC